MKSLLLLGAMTTAAAADTHRVAIVVGNNAGNPGETPLHYAETDAGKVARVLAELGGVGPDDLFLVQGQGKAAVTDALARAKQRIIAYQADPANRVVAVFYFSGHSDGQALELGADRLGFAELRGYLAQLGADVRLALVDSCKSGALLATKGGTKGPAFQIRLADELASSGEALLTSSAADEVALESREIGGSYFTHHFVSGLRGAADASGDGLVTLTEAYQYAYAHTIATTGQTVIGPQHPAYDYRLSGQGELVLTELTKPTGAIHLPSGFTRALVIDVARDQVIAELASDARTTIAVPPGRYAIRAWQGGVPHAGRFAVSAGEIHQVAWADLPAAGGVATASKGRAKAPDLPEGAPDLPGVSVAFELGGTEPIADIGIAVAARVALRSPNASGWELAVVGDSAKGSGIRETGGVAMVGWRLGGSTGAVRGWAALDAGGGFVTQSNGASTGTGVLAPRLGASIALRDDLAIAVEATLFEALLRKDDATTISSLPAVWIGVVVNP